MFFILITLFFSNIVLYHLNVVNGSGSIERTTYVAHDERATESLSPPLTAIGEEFFEIWPVEYIKALIRNSTEKPVENRLYVVVDGYNNGTNKVIKYILKGNPTARELALIIAGMRIDPALADTLNAITIRG